MLHCPAVSCMSHIGIHPSTARLTHAWLHGGAAQRRAHLVVQSVGLHQAEVCLLQIAQVQVGRACP